MYLGQSLQTNLFSPSIVTLSPFSFVPIRILILTLKFLFCVLNLGFKEYPLINGIVVSPTDYRKVQVKEGTVANVHPQLTVKGTGFSRLLGGLEMDLRLQQHLAKLFEVSIITAGHK